MAFAFSKNSRLLLLIGSGPRTTGECAAQATATGNGINAYSSVATAGKSSVATAGNGTVPLWFCLRPSRIMFARHLIGLSFCLEKATRQLCFHPCRFTRVYVFVEDIFLVVDACRRARHLEPAADFERSNLRSASAAHVPCILPEFSGVFRTGLTCFDYELRTAKKLSNFHLLTVCLSKLLSG